MNIAVSGVAVALPGVSDPRALLRPAVPGAEPVDAAALIGRKGLRFKDRATRLGLHLAHVALTDAALLDGTELTVPGNRIGTVVSSNLGNADTVCRAVETIAKESTSALSPMDTPNASSNIIASETAIRYGLRGPNLTVCNGRTSGLDAVRWATLMLRTGRADHMLVTGVEPDNEVTRRLVGGPVADGGAALVLSRTPTATTKALLGPVVRTPRSGETVARLAERVPDAGLWLTPEDVPVAGDALHLTLGGWGELSGALGVVQCAAAAGWFAQGHTDPVYVVLGGAGTALLPAGAPA
ncbi:beta-ketoacyl synthase N-terminal-like domain-containing protein [Streptomyces sp. Isolate_45]|uniref:beta-ketoacyl synthase N-terminal-like domain-containing protein n=1 Tax=Streptomyces sp. Isolate_45 TaxID=2950111 RepID=UPI002481E2D8|nr:beta-ketoacyl synthase N-terminal-like domain-containing protein [Streptomyces sp. Isolate_45]MDA5283207.1 beta-ketoacyl synthase N-terminal-like domain-containing protein [Streptomyces sp. Isolate_45]